MTDLFIKSATEAIGDNTKTKIVSPEIANSANDVAQLVADRSFEADLAVAREASQDSLYATWNDKIGSSMAAAYPLYLHLLADSQLAERVLADTYFAPEGGVRKRRPTKGKPALLALQYVTRPRGVDNLKSCSAYSTMLELAKDRQVIPREFASVMAQSTLKEALAHKRGNKKRTLKARMFRIRLSGGMGSAIHEDIVVPAVPDDAFYGRIADVIQRLLGPAAKAPDQP